MVNGIRGYSNNTWRDIFPSLKLGFGLKKQVKTAKYSVKNHKNMSRDIFAQPSPHVILFLTPSLPLKRIIWIAPKIWSVPKWPLKVSGARYQKYLHFFEVIMYGKLPSASDDCGWCRQESRKISFGQFCSFWINLN